MDNETLKWIIPIVVGIIGGVVGWAGSQYKYRRELKRQASLDADQTLKEKKSLLEELISKTENDEQKTKYQSCLDDVNTALIGLSTARVRRTLNDAGLPTEDRLIIEGKSQLQPQQAAQLNRDIAEIQNLPPSNSIQDLNALAAAYYYAGQYQKAKEILNTILKLSPNNSDAFYNLGNINFKIKKYDEALVAYNRALSLKPKDAEALYNLSCLFSMQNKIDDALVYLEKAISLNKKYKEMAKTDKDFDNIRNDPRFKKLIGE